MHLQSVLDELEPGSHEQEFVRDNTLSRLNAEWTPHKRVIRANRAFHLQDGMTQLQPHTVEFDKLELVADVPKLIVVGFAMRQIVSLPCYEPLVLGPTQELDGSLVGAELEFTGTDTALIAGERSRRPLYVPVEDVSFVALAA